MSSSSRQTSYILTLLFSIILAHSSFPSFQENILAHLNRNWEIILLGNISIDFFGGLVPIIVSFLLVLYLLCFRRFSWKRYFYGLSLAVSFGLAISSVNGAIIIRFQLFDYVLAICVFFLAYLQGRSLRNLSLDSIVISKGNYVSSLMMIYSLSSFAIFFVDLIYLPFANYTMQIGAAGLVDAIFLSGLFSVFPLTIVVASFGILLEEKRKLAFPLHRKKYENLKKQVPELLAAMVFVIAFLYILLTVVPSLSRNDLVNFGAVVIILILVFAFAYSEVRKYVESRKQKKLDRYFDNI